MSDKKQKKEETPQKESGKPIQFTSDEIAELAEIQRNYQIKFQEFGKLYVERMDLDKRFSFEGKGAQWG